MNLSLVSRIASRLRSGDIPAPSTSGRQVCRRSLLASALLLISVIPAAFAAPFTPGNLVIYRVGNGASVLSTSGALVFLDEYNPSGILVQSIQLPAASPGVIGLVASGTSVSEGLLTRSISGSHLALTGFNAAASAVDLPSSLANSVSRTVGTVDWQGNIGATTALQNYSSGTSPRSALTSDNGSFWISGGSGGLHLAALGVTTSTQIGIIPTSQRQIQSFGNQLYISSNSGPYRLATVGTGLPTSIGQTIANLPGISTTYSTSPYGFFLADLSTSVAGNDTLYIADEVLGLQKFSLVGGTWTANGSIGTDADDYRGLTASVYGTSVTLFATIKGGNDADGGGELVKLTDTTGYNATLTGTSTVLATAANNTAFRGVALAPYNLPDLTVDLAAPASAQAGSAFTYTLTARNIGNVEASDIDLFFVVPSGLTIGAINGASGFSGGADANVVFFSGGSLASGASATLTINVSSSTPGTYTTAAQAAIIDLFDFISEADETNNGSTQLVSTVVSAPPQNFINLDLLGKGGAGLLSQNENRVISGTPGTGGEVGAGCRYETNSRVLSINVAWGSQNGFVDLSSAANNSHIHGPTTSAGAASFLQNAGVIFNLPRVSSTANGGSISTTVTLSAAQEADLLAGKYYINIHTSTNGGGEIRGNLVVPSNLPTITTQPSSQTITSGAAATLTVAASGSPAPAFQWYRGNSGDTSNPILNANAATFTTPTLTTTTSYWVRAANTSGPPANSNAATITVTPPPSPEIVVEEPSGTPMTTGETRDFGNGLVGTTSSAKTFVIRNLGNAPLESLAATLGGSHPGDFTLNPSSLPATLAAPGNTSFTVTFSPTTTGVRTASLSIASNDADENPITITLTGQGVTAPSITTQPANQTIPSGSTATLTVIATGNPTPAFQWYRGNSGDTSTPVGTNSASFTTPVLITSANYWVRASNTSGIPADSNTVTITVTPPVLGPGDIAFTGFNADSTDNLAFVALVAIPAGTLIYFTDNEWNGSEIGLGGAFIDDAESEFTWTAPAGGIAAGTVVLLNDVSGGISTSVGTAAMTITTNTGISNTSDTVYAFVGGSQAPGAFVASIANHNADSLAGTSLVANNTAVFLPASTDGARYTGARSGQTSFSAYRTMIGDVAANWETTTGDGTAFLPFDSSAFTIGSPAAPAITTQPASQTINSGNTAELSVAASGFPAPTLQWYRGNSGDESNLISGATAATFTTPELSTTTNYWVRASNTSGPAADSDTATITVIVPPTITVQPASETIASGAFATLSVTATGTEPFNYQWYQGNTGDTSMPVGTNSPSFTTPALTGLTAYWVKVSNAANPAGINSNTATVNATGGLIVKTYDTAASTANLNTIANLMALTPSGTSVQTADLVVPSGTAAATYPGLTDSDSYSLLWEGWFDVMKDGPGIYTFGTHSDDGSIIFLDLNHDGNFNDSGEKIVDNNYFKGSGRVALTGSVALNTDAVRIAIGFYDQGGPDYMAARFKKGSGVSFASLVPINGTSGHFFTARPPANPAAANLWNFGIASYPAVVNGTNIVWTFPNWTNLESLAPTFMISEGATALPASGTPRNFTTPQTYTVTARDGTTQTYTVTARKSIDPLLHTFDTGNQGWRVASFSSPDTNNSILAIHAPFYTATGGNPGGYIGSGDPDVGGFYFAAPTSFVSGLVGAFGARLSYDFSYDGVGNNSGRDVILEGGGIRLLWESPVYLLPTSGWKGVALTFAPSPQWRLGTKTGSFATSADFEAVLANPTGLFFKGEYTANGSDLARIDNVSVAPATSPVIFIQPVSQTIPAGTATTLTVYAVGTEPFTYQWYQGSSGDTSTPVGADSASFITPAIINTNSYWVKVSNPLNLTGVNSDTATIIGRSEPLVTTAAATSVTETSATLDGTVNPFGQETTARFEYGITTAYGSFANVTLDPANGITNQNVSAVVTGLELGQTYHYRLTATYSGGTVLGNDAIFTTAPSNTLNRVWVGAGNQTFPEAIWGGVLNWTTGVAANGANTIATLGNSFNNGYTCALSFAPTIGRLVYNDPANANDFIIRNNASNFLLTLDVTSGLPSINVAQADRTLVIEPRIGGNDGFAKNGPGRVVLANGNSIYTGPIQINAGLLEIGGGVFTVNNGKTAPDYVEQAFDLGTAGRVGNGNYAGNVFIAGGAGFLYNSSVDTTLNGVIGGGGSLRKAGASILALTNANTYTGATTIIGGTLRLGSSTSLPATTDLVMDGGILDLNGHNATIRSLAVSGVDVVIDFGSASGANTLRISNGASGDWTGNLQILNFDPSTDQLFFGTSMSGIGENAAGVTFVDPVGLAPGTYPFRIGSDGSSGPSYPPVITTHPVSQTIASGSTATLSVVATGSPAPTFQWYRGNSGDTSDPVSNATSSSFTTPALTANMNHWVKVSNTSGPSVDSNTATVSINLLVNGSFEQPVVSGRLLSVYAPNSTTVPGWTVSQGDIEICTPAEWAASEGNQSLDVSGVSAATLYQDLAGLIPGATYQIGFDLSGNPVLPSEVIKLLRVSAGTVISNFDFDVTGFDRGNMGWTPKVISFVAQGTTTRLQFQSLNGGDRGPALDNVSLVLTDPPLAVPPAITTHPVSQTIASGSTATLSVVATGNPAPTFQWYRGNSGDTSTPVGINSASFTTPALTTTTSYWVQATNSSGPAANSDTATVTVQPPAVPEIVFEDSDGAELASDAVLDFGNVLVGSAAVEKTFVVRNTGNAPLSITDPRLLPAGVTDFSISGANLPASIAAGQSAMLRIAFHPTSGGERSGLFRFSNNDADEGEFIVSLMGTGFTPPLFTDQPAASQTIIYNASAMLEASASGHPQPTYQWYRGLSGDTSQEIIGATSAQFNTSALTVTQSYWVRATNSVDSVDSQTAFVEVEPISTNALLSNLLPSAGQFSPGFGPGTGFYTLLVPSSVSELTLTPFAAHPAASILINGVPVHSGNASQVIPIGFGENPVNMIVTAQDGETIRSYLINATRSQPMFVSTENASGITRTAATLNGTVIPYGTATVRFEYGQTTNYEFSTPPQQVSGSNIADVQFPLVNLLPGTRYHFRMVASNGVDTEEGINRFFDTLPGDPLVLTGNPVDVTTASATLVGAVDGRGADVTIYFEYGTDFPLTKTAEQFIPAADGYKDVSANVSGLIPNANYQVRLVARVGTNPPTNGSLRTFIATPSDSTGGTPSGPPIVTTGDVVSITTNSAEIRGSVNAQGGTTAVWIEYGTTSALGLKGEVVREIGNTQGATDISIPISGLVSGTDYHYRVVAQNSLGNVPGQIDTFRTNFLPPEVTTGSVSVLSTTSVRVFGTVRANRSDATVRFRYGTSPGNLDLLIDAAPAIVTGDVNRTVSADLPNLRQGTRYYYQVEANNGGGEDIGSQRPFDVAILSGLDRRFPEFINPLSHQGSLQVNLTPPATGGWRFSGEIGWRAPGSTATGLAAGDRRIEYRSAAGYITPATETLTIASVSELQSVNRAYVSTSTPGSGRLRVSIKPDSLSALTNTPLLRAQWRLAGESDSAWRNTDTEVAGLVPGNHVIESKAIAGYETPAPVNVVIGDGQTTVASITYYISADPVGTVPSPVPFASVAGDSSQPFGFVGQIFSDSGASTGFVVKPRVVATAGHVVFDDGSLSAATNLTWLFQREIDVHEPVPVPPRGFYLMSGYAAQRAIDNTPGVSTPSSQNLDAAALYFADNAISRNGYSGYLASDLAENEFLISNRDKMLAGYPVEGVAVEAIGRMHATPAANVGFSQSYLRTYLTTGIRGSGGMSGGPLFVREASGIWYPAAIYLGGTRQMIVRAIDSDVADLFGFAEASAEVVEGSTGGTGVLGASSPLPTPDMGGIRVNIAPAAARNAGAGWRINTGEPYKQSATQIVDLSPNTYTVRFSSVPGFLPPTPQTVTVTGGQLAKLTFTYEELILPPVITSPTSVTRIRGQNLFYQITTQPAAQTYSLFGALPPGVEFNAALGQITGIPQTAGAFVIQAGATNLGGSGSKPITLNVLPVLAAQAVPAVKGSALNHPLVSGESGSGMSWSASQLPDGLVLDAASGVVSGIPTVAGVFDVNISLTRNGATASALATFTILGEAPAFTLEPPTNRAIEFGTSTTFVVAASGEPAPTYQWYRGSSGNIANPVIGATSPTFVTPVLTEPASFWVRATSIGRTTDSRAVAISLNPSGNADLASLETDAGLPSPSFNSAVLGYRITVAHTTSTIRVLPAARVSQTSIQVNGQTVISGTASDPIPVATGTSRITVQTTAGNGSTVRNYTLDVTRLPLPNAVTDPASSVNDFSAQLNGRVIPNGQGEAYFEYGLTTAYGLRTPRQSVAGDQPLAIASDIAGLDPLTTYHFRAVLESGGQVYFDSGREFNTTRKPPTVATGSVFRSTTADATLTGAVNPNGQNVTLFFEYGLNTLLGARTTEFLPTPNGGSSALDVSKIITGLQANNTYFYRLVAKDEAGVEWLGIIESFTAENSTGTADGIADSAPSVTTGQATDLTTTSATLAGIATPNDGSTEVWFEYGPAGQPFTDSTPIQLIGNGSQPRNATWPISGLVPEASYHFRMMARNSIGETPGSTVTFETRFNPPVVTIGTVEALSATSVRITGSVDPKGTATSVDFRYGAAGANFPLGAIASEGVQTGSGLRPVSVILINLKPSQVYETQIEASSDGGGVKSQILSFQPGALLGLIQQFPETTPKDDRSGQLTVNILPTGTGAWRFAGETLWRSSEIPATGLTTGNRVIEFRPEIGFNRPPAESVSIVSGNTPVVVEALYYPAPEPGLAAITVNLKPSSISDASLPTASRAQWRFAGVAGDPWKNSGTTVSELPEGSYLIECKTVSGRQTPLPRAVALANDENRSVTFTYFAATSPILNPPAPVSYETAVADPTRSSGYVGQVRSDLGTSSGFAVKRRVVATAAQAVFDEATLSLTANIEWLWLPDRNNHAPKPIAARGVYVFDGYAAQRSSEATPGTLSSVSQNLNVAAIYFSEDAARGGSSGFLASDETENPYLVSSLPKMLAGYPSVNVSPSNLGRLHVLNPTTASLTHVIGRTFDSAFIRGFGGMAGGPLSVRPDNGSFYPAGIYVGGTTRGIVRAIDTPIIDLFSRAEVSGNGGDNDTGGGITHTSFANLTSSKAKGAVTVIIRPASAVNLNAGWRLTSAQSLKDSEAQIGNLTPGTYSLLLSTIPGFPAPPPASIKVESGKTTQIIFDYSTINSEPTISEMAKQLINEDTTTQPIAFTIGDMQSSADSLTLTRTSSNSALIPNTNIVLSGTGANRTVTITPVANQSGTATITIAVSDGSLSASRSFLLTVNPVNDTPVFSPIANQNLVVNQVLGPLSFSVSDLETSNLGVSATSSNTALVQNAAIILTGTGANRSLSLIPVAGQIGSTTITLTVTDGLVSTNRNFLVTVSGTPLDTWRFANFGTAANSGNAADSFDADGDNKSNIDEYAAGTDPRNPSDFFRVLTSTHLGSDFRVTVPGRANRNYVLQRTTSLTTPVWTPVATSGVLELSATLQLIDNAPPAGSAFYRVLVNTN